MPGMARRAGGQARRHRLPWVSDAVALSDRLGTTETTAQVDPGRFTRAMMRAAAAHGAELHRAAVTGIARRDGAVAASRSTGERSTLTPSSSRWARGRALPPNGCRSRPSTG